MTITGISVSTPSPEARAPGRRGEALREAALLQSVAVFVSDVLGEHPEESGWWISPPTKKRWRRYDGIAAHQDAVTAVARHVNGTDVHAVNGLHHTIVLDLDLFGVGEGEEAPDDLKAEVAQSVSLVLDSHDIPHVHIGSRRGVHTWIRADFDPPDHQVEQLRRLVHSAVEALGNLDAFPKGKSQIKLPFGRYCGRLRGFLGEEYDLDQIAGWLERPARASEAQIASAAAFAPTPPAPGRAAPASLPSLAQGERPIRGFESWPVCKQEKFFLGVERQGERHHLFNVVAAEAVLHADLDLEELVALQLAIPLNGLSMSSDRARVIDARRNAKDVLRRKGDGNPLLSGCGYGDTSSDFISAFSSRCTETRARTCLLAFGVEPESTIYRDVLRSTLWRGSQGSSHGLGLTSRAVYSDVIRRAHGLPGSLVRAEGRYLECRLRYVTRNVAQQALRKLTDADVELLRKSSGDQYELLPPPDPAALRNLEERLGTFAAWDRARKRHEQHWLERAADAVAQLEELDPPAAQSPPKEAPEPPPPRGGGRHGRGPRNDL